MTTTHELRPAVDGRYRLPYPNGWFGLCFSEDLARGAVRILPLMGGELVVYRTHAGLARIVSPYCPHLGAHLGHGGRVVGEHLVCPYHGLHFDPEGECVWQDPSQTFRGPALACWRSHEVNGVVFVWHDDQGRQPAWEIPEIDLRGFSRPSFQRLDIAGYAQDGAENGADSLHLSYVHGFTNVRLSPTRIDGPRLSNDIEQLIKGRPAYFHSTWHGIGYLSAMLEFPSLGLRANTQVLFTQTTPLGWVLLARHVFRIDLVELCPRSVRSAIYAAIGMAFTRWFHRENMKDFIIWNHKTYLPQPKLVPGDGPIMQYRRWASQFYPAVADGRAADLSQASGR